MPTPVTFNIRPATAADIPVVVDYNVALALESEHKQLDHATVERGVRRGFDQGAEVTYLLAELPDRSIAGQIMLTREWSDWRDGWIYWLQSVFVRPDCRSQGVFRKLLEDAVRRLEADPDVVGLRLYVEVENRRAQEVYLRNGFVDASYRVLERMFRT